MLASIATIPSVSIILPTFNRTKFLKLAIESVYAQSYTDWEMIIADDGSNEDTIAYLRNIKNPRVTTILLPHSGNPSRVRNIAIKAANGRYLAFLDSDDLWSPSKLEKQLLALSEHSRCRWGYTACDRIDENGNPLANERLRTLVLREGWVFEALLKLEVSIAMPTVIAEHTLINEINGFDEQLPFGEFHDLCLRLAMTSEATALLEPLCSVRAHNEHYSSDRIAAQLSWMRLYKKMAGLVRTAKLRRQCMQMCANISLTLVRLQLNNGNHSAALVTLYRALIYSWHYPKWWYGALKEVFRHTLVQLRFYKLKGNANNF